MKRFPLILAAVLAWGGAAFADSEKDAADVVTTIVTALADDNIAGFMKPIDPALPGYAKLRGQVETLIGRAQVSSSISILENEGGRMRIAREPREEEGQEVAEDLERHFGAVGCVDACHERKVISAFFVCGTEFVESSGPWRPGVGKRAGREGARGAGSGGGRDVTTGKI